MGTSFNENEIDKAHGIRKHFLDMEQNQKIRSITVKFKLGKLDEGNFIFQIE